MVMKIAMREPKPSARFTPTLDAALDPVDDGEPPEADDDDEGVAVLVVFVPLSASASFWTDKLANSLSKSLSLIVCGNDHACFHPNQRSCHPKTVHDQN